ncbi:hypothetical protein Cflav_PD0494 [Pedosphaera parvula Ellin514]|uniref:Uncharacterized protein n=1 Tax=Pedosphaera parvula (strain Ellin514) TaxID=320771 RepID=B9XRP5_PEDPL|nr:hypothetical protein Cflav_PD0494 [Pedosphaera parvula Ellin514]
MGPFEGCDSWPGGSELRWRVPLRARVRSCFESRAEAVSIEGLVSSPLGFAKIRPVLWTSVNWLVSFHTGFGGGLGIDFFEGSFGGGGDEAVGAVNAFSECRDGG